MKPFYSSRRLLLLLHSALFMLFVQNNLCAQNINNLKNLNGFRDFKYGDKKEKFDGKYNLELDVTASEGKNTEYIVENFYNRNRDYKKFGIEFDGTRLFFTENKLYQISLSKMMSFEDVIVERDAMKSIGGRTTLDKILDELSLLFGEEVHNSKGLNNETIVTFKDPSIDNVCELTVEVNEVFRTMFITLTFYNKPLTNISRINKFN
ncbi:hypothetical protein [Pontibacter chinhatensis]|uniref:Uncharacterized protein n=1 Tax=Pontibacter chinhatensis TaxID=1436961 RepID=A0A1I2S5Q1_9BACT|nr:hypothetical protein [Pontibacter chinhatensis]SFG48138.1 hypothetical protein SAMN05421739_102657 [Pontibacter chinhatensis]